MGDANINDRATIEQAYPRQAFEEDIRKNSDAKATVQRGVRIAAAPDGAGAFRIVRASRHVGEIDDVGETVFLSPVRSFDAALKPNSSGYGQEEAEAGGLPAEPGRSAGAYDAFLGAIVEAVRTAHFETPLAANDERLKGFHGG